MNKQLDVKAIERKVYTSYFSDGTLDFTVALIFLFFSLTLFTSRLEFGDLLSVIISFVPSILLYGFIIMVKKKITIPRLGTIVFNNKRKKMTIGLIGIPVLTILVGLVIYFTIPNKDEGIIRSLFFGSIFVIVFTIAAYLISTIRLSLYGGLATIAFITGKWLERGTGMTFVLPIAIFVIALIALTVGIVLLVKFIKKTKIKDIGKVDD